MYKQREYLPFALLHKCQSRKDWKLPEYFYQVTYKLIFHFYCVFYAFVVHIKVAKSVKPDFSEV